jgi:hypothetical protein
VRRAARGRRGGALLEVLLLAVVAAFLCASVLRARLEPALTAAGQVERLKDDLAGEGALARVRQVWAEGGTCSSSPAAGVSCAGGGCDCVCTVAGLGKVASVGDGGACALTTSPEGNP